MSSATKADNLCCRQSRHDLDLPVVEVAGPAVVVVRTGPVAAD